MPRRSNFRAISSGCITKCPTSKLTEKLCISCNETYEEWAKKTIPEVKDILLKGLDLTDAKNFDKMLDVAFKLT